LRTSRTEMIGAFMGTPWNRWPVVPATSSA
jgi:hypothetical protein